MKMKNSTNEPTQTVKNFTQSSCCQYPAPVVFINVLNNDYIDRISKYA